jgi:hypothetical protein
MLQLMNGNIPQPKKQVLLTKKTVNYIKSTVTPSPVSVLESIGSIYSTPKYVKP